MLTNDSFDAVSLEDSMLSALNSVQGLARFLACDQIAFETRTDVSQQLKDRINIFTNSITRKENFILENQENR